MAQIKFNLYILCALVFLAAVSAGTLNSKHPIPELFANNDNQTVRFPRFCSEVNFTTNGIYRLHLPEFGYQSFWAYCKKDPNDGLPWTVIQRRTDGKTEFNKNWQNYVLGFGNLENEFFMGLEKIYASTQYRLHQLRVDFTYSNNVVNYGLYDTFAIGNDRSKYILNVLGAYSGNAINCFGDQAGERFSTFDVQNNDLKENCAQKFQGGWWYKDCTNCQLNGNYANLLWGGNTVRKSEMAIRPVKR